jgi:hypothetical protein
MVARVARGVGGGSGFGSVVASVGLQSGSSSRLSSYDASLVLAFAPSNAATTGNMLITVAGRGLSTVGFSGRVRVSVSASPGLNAATSGRATNWMSNTMMIARVAHGFTSRSELGFVTASVAQLFGASSRLFSFNSPSMSSVRFRTVPASGSHVFETFGRVNFGLSSFSSFFRFDVRMSTKVISWSWRSDSVLGKLSNVF